MEISRHIGIMGHQRFYLEKQVEILQVEEIGGFAEISIDQFFNPQVIMAVPFYQVTQQALKSAWLEGLQLLLHRFHI